MLFGKKRMNPTTRSSRRKHRVARNPWRKLGFLSGIIIAVLLGTVLLIGHYRKQTTDVQYVEQARTARDKGDWRSNIIHLKNALQRNSTNREARQLLGEAYVEVGDGAAAEKELRQALELGVPIEQVAVPLSRALLLQGKWDEVLALEAPLQGMPEDGQATVLALRGQAHLGKGDLEAADKQLQSAQQLKADSPVMLLGQAMLAVQRQQWEEAHRWTERALVVQPGFAEAWSLQGDLEQRAAHPDKAEAAYTQAARNRLNNKPDLLKRALVRNELKNYEGAQKDIGLVQQNTPNYPGSHYVQGRIYLAQQRLGDAQSAFERELKINQNHPLTLYYLTQTHLGQNQLQQAEQYSKRLLGLFPQSNEAALLLARAQLRDNKIDDAESILKPVLQRNPDDVEAISLMSAIQAARGNQDSSIQYLEKAVEQLPAAANLRLQLGSSLLLKGNREQGIQELKKALELNPDLQQAEQILIIDSLSNQQFDKALELTLNLVSKHPDNAVAYNVLGMIYIYKNQDQEARQAFEQALKLRPDFSTAAMNLAKLEFKTGNLQAVEAHLQRILEQDPNNLDALLGLATMAEQRQQPDRVLTWLEKAWQNHPDSPATGLLLAQAYLNQNKRDQASDLFNSLYKNYPKDPAVSRNRGLMQLAGGEPASALANFRKLTMLQPQSPEAWHLLAITQIRLQDVKSASQAIDKALALQVDYLPSLMVKTALLLQEQRFKDALASANNIQKLYPNSSLGLQLEGDIYLQQKDFAKAIAIYKTAYAKSADAQLLLRLSNAQRLAGDSEGGLQLLRQWLAAHPQDTQVRAQLATALQRQGRLTEAVAEQEQLAAPNPEAAKKPGVTPAPSQESNQSTEKLIQLYLLQKDYDKAIAAASKLVNAQPNEAMPHNILGVVYMLKGMDEQARSEFEATLKLKPELNIALINLARLDLKAGNKEAAATRYQQVLKQDEKNLDAMLGLAGLAAQVGHSDEAVSWLEKAWAISPNLLVGGSLVNQYMARNDNSKALTVARRLYDDNPSNPQAVELLGNVLQAKGDPKEALSYFRKLTELQPQAPVAWYRLGIAQGRSQDFKAMGESLDRALALQNNYLPAMIAKSELQLKNERTKEALDTARTIQTQYSSEGIGYKLEGDVYLQQKEYAKAITAYQTAYDKVPNYLFALTLANAQWLADNKEAAISSLHQWLEKMPADARVRLQLALYLEKLGHPEAALAEYEQLPDDALALNQLALLYQQKGEVKRALDTAEQAAKLAPKQPEIMDTLGSLLVQAGQVERGLQLLKQAAEQTPQVTEIRYNLAAAYQRAGFIKQARTELEQLLREAKTTSEKERAKRLIDELPGKSQ